MYVYMKTYIYLSISLKIDQVYKKKQISGLPSHRSKYLAGQGSSVLGRRKTIEKIPAGTTLQPMGCGESHFESRHENGGDLQRTGNWPLQIKKYIVMNKNHGENTHFLWTESQSILKYNLVQAIAYFSDEQQLAL